MAIITYTKKLTHNKSCRDVCAPMILYQAYTNSSKLDLKNTTKLQQIKEVVVRGGARNFCLGGPICVASLLVYTNFHTHTQTHASIHIQKKLVSFIINP